MLMFQVKVPVEMWKSLIFFFFFFFLVTTAQNLYTGEDKKNNIWSDVQFEIWYKLFLVHIFHLYKYCLYKHVGISDASMEHRVKVNMVINSLNRECSPHKVSKDKYISAARVYSNSSSHTVCAALHIHLLRSTCGTYKVLSTKYNRGFFPL